MILQCLKCFASFGLGIAVVLCGPAFGHALKISDTAGTLWLVAICLFFILGVLGGSYFRTYYQGMVDRAQGLYARMRDNQDSKAPQVNVKSVEIDGKVVEFTQDKVGGISVPMMAGSKVVITYETSVPVQRMYPDTSCRNNPPFCDVCGMNMETNGCSPMHHAGDPVG